MPRRCAAGRVGRREPDANTSTGRHRADGRGDGRPASRQPRQMAAHDQEQEAEEQPGARAVAGTAARKIANTSGIADAARPVRSSVSRPCRRHRAAERQGGERRHREDRKMPIASDSWLADRNLKTQPHWYSVVSDRASATSAPATSSGRDPREPDVEQQQVREQRDRPVLAGRQQRRRREAAEQPEHRDEERLAPDRQQHRERGDQREQREGQPRPESGSRARARRRTWRTGSRSPRRRARWRSTGYRARPSARRRPAARSPR